MSFEDDLRRRLHDLADDEQWPDPAAAARARAATLPADDDGVDVPAPPPGGGGGPGADRPVVVPLERPAARRRSRVLPGLAVAAVAAAVLVGGGFGIAELVGNHGGGGASGGSMAVAGQDEATAPPSAAGSAAPGGGTGNSASCADLGAPRSTGALADVATIRPSGITGSTTTAGGTAGVPYTLQFAQDGPALQARAAEVYLVEDGRMVGTGGLSPGVVQNIPATAGTTRGGSATFTATDCEGNPLPKGGYQVVVVIPYATSGDPTQSLLVSAPVAVTVR